MRLSDNDPWLKPYEGRIQKRNEYMHIREKELTQGGDISLSEFADGYLYYGMHRDQKGDWVIREFLPGAQKVYLIGDFNEWQTRGVWKLSRIDDYGNWELKVSASALKHGDLYKLYVVWDGGSGERIPAWARRVVQDPNTSIFSAQVWEPSSPYIWKNSSPKKNNEALMIYEAHIGMASEEHKVASYKEFTENVLPRVARLGYNTIQLMAIQEHPYYGSFGYHVSSFFAPSSRFGTAEDLKELIDTAHGLGIKVIMDLVHSHAVKNQVEGLALYDGTRTLFFHEGKRGEHPAWDSLCFDYRRNNVMHFLLSNCKYWLEEFHFDGFRFDGVSSMLYYNHGLGQTFTSYSDYFNGHQDADAMAYLAIANKLIHTINPDAITIAEEVSGMPGLAAPIEFGGFGFDYRLQMNIPDYWIKMIKEKKDEEWNPGDIFYELTNRRSEEKTISYSESHDQALVGDKTIIFRLADSDMYWHMSHNDRNITIDRAIALHKMIRLITISTINGGYLNFMGNEFGHPEWIDFPRQENNWSYQYARRQWSLADDTNLFYNDLEKFDTAMIKFISSIKGFQNREIEQLWSKEDEQVLAFAREDLLFVFNFSPINSYNSYEIPVKEGRYEIVLSTDAKVFGGFDNIDPAIKHIAQKDNIDANNYHINLYLPSRTAIVLKRK